MEKERKATNDDRELEKKATKEDDNSESMYVVEPLVIGLFMEMK
jgi:hypothetical protein